MALLLIFGIPCAIAAAIASYGFVLSRSVPVPERPTWVWSAALVLLLILDVGLTLAFLLAIAVYNCHGANECPF